MMREKRTPPQLAIGFHAIEAAIVSGKQIEKILIQRGLKGELFQKTMALVQEHQIPFQYVPVEKLQRITTKNHQGILAFLSPITFGSIEEIVSLAFEEGKNPLILLLDGLTDVRNVGAIARTAECLGATAVVMTEMGSAPINEDTIKTSAGALMHLPVCKTKMAVDTIHLLQSMGIHCIAATEKATLLPEECDMRVPLCIVMGNEEKGISKAALKAVQQGVRIPMTGITTSLNVSVAAGMLLYETVRQRRGSHE
ncbi:MAG: rRNA ((2251)-2-O)-methyltransferase RlmB [Bacteroidota bacterium]|jgi:23S rRNA (guanosine2251-2'-O)-methyltransferase